MKESVAAAAQYIKTSAKDLGLPNDWQSNYDIAVLATMMGVPKEGPSAGISITTGIVSALTGRPVRNDIAMTGEITIMGKVLAIGGVLPKLQAAIDAGCAEVIMPKENQRDVEMTPDYVKGKIKVRFVSSIQEVLAAALVPKDDLSAGTDLSDRTSSATS
jgi:ATP-dependent Lon protease